MKTSQPFVGKLSKVHINWLRILLVMILLSAVIVPGLIKSAGVGAAVAAPQKNERDAEVDSVIASFNQIPPIGGFESPPPLPDFNPIEDPPPSPPNILNSGTIVNSVPTGNQSRDFIYGDWSVYSNYPSICTIDTNKRALAITLILPQYQYEILFSASQGWIWHKIWMWDTDSQKWLTHPGWSEPVTQIASNIYPVNLYNIVFRQPHYFALGGSENGTMSVVLSPSSGLSGPQRVVIDRYVILKQKDQTLINIPSRVIFDNGGNICGHDFPVLSQSSLDTEGGTSGVELAPTPPASNHPPAFSYIPLLLKSGKSNTDPVPTPTPLPTLSAPPTPSSPPTTAGIDNESFDDSTNGGWTEYSSEGYDIIMAGPKGFSARSDPNLAWLGGAHSDTSRISQNVTVPDSHPYLSLHMMATSQEDLCNYDRALIMVDDFHVATIGLCKPQNFHGWLKNQIDLSDFAGKTVNLAIQVETDNSQLSSLFVDDISFESGVFIPTPVPTSTPLPGNNPIRNPGFELGNNGDWGSYSSLGATNIFLLDGARSGNWLAWLGGLHNEDGYIDQMISIPSDKPYLTYWGWISSSESTCGGDTVKFLAGNTELYGYDLCSAYNSAQWGLGWVNLSAYAGTTQRIRIQVETNASLSSSLFMDDFSFVASPPTSIMFSELGSQPSEINGSPGSTGVAPSGEVITSSELELKSNTK